MQKMDYVIYKEDKYFVSQCLNVNVSSFGNTFDEALANLKEAVELYFRDEKENFNEIEEIKIGKETVNV